MAYTFKKINVLDLDEATGVGISLPFDGPTGINTTYTTRDQIKSNLINFILTGDRERVMNPSFGAGILGSTYKINPDWVREYNIETGETYNWDSFFDNKGDGGVLFNQTTENMVGKIETLIYGGIERYFNNTISVKSLSVDLNPNNRSITIYLKYKVIYSNEEDEFTTTVTT